MRNFEELNENLGARNPPPLSKPNRNTMNGKPVYEVPAKSVLNLESGFAHKLLCDGPTFSLGSACAYSCSFCYVEDLMRKNPHWQSVVAQNPGSRFEDVVIRRSGAVEALRRQLTDSKGNPRYCDMLDRRVIYASPLVDVAANMELVRETVEACLAILELTNWQIRLLSKSNLLPKVAELLGDKFNAASRVIYGVSTGTLDDFLAKAFEKGTPLVSKRIESLHWLQDRGYRTFGMICPSLPQKDYVAFFEEALAAIRADHCEHIWGEVINLRGDSFTKTIDAINTAGFGDLAEALRRVSTNKDEWENYARKTFEAGAALLRGKKGPDGLPKFRFLQYVTATSRPWWASRQSDGAIML